MADASANQEVRCAVRFPLNLPVVISTSKSEYCAFTNNVSASGVLFDMNSPLLVGEGIDFSLRMPGPILVPQRMYWFTAMGVWYAAQ